MRNPKAKKISLTADMRHYLATIITQHRDELNYKLTKSKTKNDLHQQIANDTQLLNKLYDK
jgi:hypothetical protein